jgi:hypothetical protein
MLSLLLVRPKMQMVNAIKTTACRAVKFLIFVFKFLINNKFILIFVLGNVSLNKILLYFIIWSDQLVVLISRQGNCLKGMLGISALNRWR